MKVTRITNLTSECILYFFKTHFNKNVLNVPKINVRLCFIRGNEFSSSQAKTRSCNDRTAKTHKLLQQMQEMRHCHKTMVF